MVQETETLSQGKFVGVCQFGPKYTGPLSAARLNSVGGSMFNVLLDLSPVTEAFMTVLYPYDGSHSYRTEVY
jgi:hypothetical protein